MSMSDCDLYDQEPVRRVQPGTKIALALIAGCFLAGIVVLIATLASRDAEPASPGATAERPATLARSATPAKVASSGSSAFAGIAFLVLLGSLALGYVVLTILLLAWVARDARCRGLDTGPWVIALLMSNVVGFLVYLASRPYGELTLCSNCGNKKLAAARRCPHCGDAGRRH